MKYAVSATLSATLTDCSTRIDRGARGAHLVDEREQLRDDHRGEAERELVDQQQAGLRQERHAEREHLLLPAREVAGGSSPACREDREQLEHVLDAGLGLLVRRRSSHHGRAQVLLDGQRREHALPAGHLRDAERGDSLGPARR